MKIVTGLKEELFPGWESYGSRDWATEGRHRLPSCPELKEPNVS